MEGKIGDLLLSVGIKIYHKMEKLSEKELKAQGVCINKLSIELRKQKGTSCHWHYWSCRFR